MIEISGLKKSFGQLDVLEDINFTINSGEIYGLVGRSGAGKSTLLRCINGLTKYDSGSLKVNGIEINDLSEKDLRNFRKKVGMIFQNFSLLERLSIYENVALPMRCSKFDAHHIDKKVRETLELVGISDKINQRPRTLSGGQKQRVAIARALALEPNILLCDEATSALDPKTTKSILTLLKEINEDLGLTIIVVTHQMDVVRSICEKISILENGRVATTGSVADIFLNQPTTLKNLLGEDEFFLPKTGVNIKVILSGSRFDENTIISSMSRYFDFNFPIVGGKIEKYRDQAMGYLILNIDYEKYNQVVDYLQQHHINWEQISNTERLLEQDL